MRIYIIPILFLGLFKTINAQYHLSVQLDGIAAFNSKELTLNNKPVNEQSHLGFALNAINQWQFNESLLSLDVMAGIKQLYFSGTFEDENFEGATSKLIGGIGTSAMLFPDLHLSLYGTIENNLDFDDFRTQAADLWRFGILTGLSYDVADNWSINAQYSLGLSPMKSPYLIYNPAHQVWLGLTYKIIR